MSVLTTMDQKYLLPQTEMEDFDLYPSFAKKSKEVTRYSEAELPEQTLWGRDLPLSCTEEPFTHEPFHVSPLNIHSSQPAGLVGRHNAGGLGLTHQMLPRPSQLMGRRRRDQTFHRHAANVLQHIGDLRMRQRHINELKEDRWWGTTAMPKPEETRVPQEFKEDRNEQHYGLTADFLFTGCEQEFDLAPGGNPMMSFVEGTAHRSVMTPTCALLNSGRSAGILSDHDEMPLFQNIQLYHP